MRKYLNVGWKNSSLLLNGVFTNVCKNKNESEMKLITNKQTKNIHEPCHPILFERQSLTNVIYFFFSFNYIYKRKVENQSNKKMNEHNKKKLCLTIFMILLLFERKTNEYKKEKKKKWMQRLQN